MINTILALDVGTDSSGYCLMGRNNYIPYEFGKVDNNTLLNSIVKMWLYDALVYEEFQSYGMAIGKSTITSITWNGRFIQAADERHIPFYPLYRLEEKLNLCGTAKAKDANLRQAMIDRFAKFDFKNGKGTKANQDWFYGFSKDAWSAAIIGVTFIDKINKEAVE
jgi:hypothetical protein